MNIRRITSTWLLAMVSLIPASCGPSGSSWTADPGTQAVLDRFQELNRIPRCPGNELGIRTWLQQWGKTNGFAVRTDDTGNVFIRVPASSGLEQAQVIVLHGCMDMECNKAPDSPHDWTKDPVTGVLDGEWLRSDMTSMGTLDGMGMAMALTLATDPAVLHPPLQLLFTVQGMGNGRGAKALTKTSLEGKTLVSLDGIREGTLFVGDTGLTEATFSLLTDSEDRPASSQVARLKISGIKGGHGGVEIDAGGGNAIHLLARSLAALQADTPLRVSGLNGGTSQYQIAKEAGATLAFPPNQLKVLQAHLEILKRDFLKECPASPGLSLALEPLTNDVPGTMYNPESTARVIAFLAALPNGVHTRDVRFKGLPGAFNNLAQLKSGEFGIMLLGTQRGSTGAGLRELNQRLRKVAEAHKAQFRAYDWEVEPWFSPQPSDLVQRLRSAYAEQFRQEPTVSLLCAATEAGLIARNCNIADAVVLGPTVEQINGPGERVHIPSIQRLRILLEGLLASYK